MLALWFPHVSLPVIPGCHYNATFLSPLGLPFLCDSVFFFLSLPLSGFSGVSPFHPPVAWVLFSGKPSIFHHLPRIFFLLKFPLIQYFFLLLHPRHPSFSPCYLATQPKPAPVPPRPSPPFPPSFPSPLSILPIPSLACRSQWERLPLTKLLLTVPRRTLCGRAPPPDSSPPPSQRRTDTVAGDCGSLSSPLPSGHFICITIRCVSPLVEGFVW